jgi:hypothetical protein
LNVEVNGRMSDYSSPRGDQRVAAAFLIATGLVYALLERITIGECHETTEGANAAGSLHSAYVEIYAP